MSTKWKFDNYDGLKDEDKLPSLVELSINDNEYEVIKVYVKSHIELEIEADRDQWGVYYTFSIQDKKFTIAQEDDTRSFLDGLIRALTVMKSHNELSIPSEES